MDNNGNYESDEDEGDEDEDEFDAEYSDDDIVEEGATVGSHSGRVLAPITKTTKLQVGVLEVSRAGQRRCTASTSFSIFRQKRAVIL